MTLAMVANINQVIYHGVLTTENKGTAVYYYGISITLATDIYDKDKGYTISLSIIIRQYPNNKLSSLFVLGPYL
jgi:hypothetical protein